MNENEGRAADERERLKELAVGAFSQMRGRIAWRPLIGIGSFLTIEFGEMRVSSTGRELGEYSLWVYGASWTITRSSLELASSEDERQVMAAAAAELDGFRLKEVSLNPEKLDLKLSFEGGLYVMATAVVDAEMEDWILFLADDSVITAGPSGQMSLELPS